VLELYRRAPGALDDQQLAHASAGAEAIGHEVLTRLPEVASPAESALHAEAALLHPSNPFTRADVYVASGLVASQLDVSTDDALARIRAHAFARGMDLTATAADIVSGRLKLPAADR
jgi:hypothetical protein